MPTQTGFEKLILHEENPDRPDYWMLWWSIEGDLRFLSHHNLMRVVSLAVKRCGLPVRYTRGFNPRPVLSLPVPKSVGISGSDERLVLALDESVDADDLCNRLNIVSPRGIRFHNASMLEDRKTIHPLRIIYRADLSSISSGDLANTVYQLQAKEIWPVERRKKAGRYRKTSDMTVKIDLKPMVENITIDNTFLQFTCIPSDGKWAKPAEILSLLGFEGFRYVSTLIRTKIEDDRDTL